MANAYWFIPSRVNEAIDALQDLGYVISIIDFRDFAVRYKKTNSIVYRVSGGLTFSKCLIGQNKKTNPHDTHIDLLGPKEIILTDEYKESQDSFAELCNTTEYIT